MTTVPLTHGEEWGQRWDFNRLVENHDVDYIRATLPNTGGITEMMKIAAICETHAVGIIPHFTGPVATAALAGYQWFFDWGAVAAYAALGSEPGNWRRSVIVNIPPAGIFGQVVFSYEQIKRFGYIWFFQMDCAQDVLTMGNLSFLDGLWGDWSPGYDATSDLEKAKACLRNPANLTAALGYYRTVFSSKFFGKPDYVAAQGEVGHEATHGQHVV